MKENESGDGGADGADPGPHGIGDPDRKPAGGDGEKRHADDHGGADANRRPKSGEPGGGFKSDGPDDFESGGKKKQRPVHPAKMRRVAGRGDPEPAENRMQFRVSMAGMTVADIGLEWAC